MSIDWALGLAAGTALGFSLARLFVEPYWITPESKSRLYVAAVGILAASVVTAVRSRLARKRRQPSQDSAAQPPSSL